jgi:ABC-type glycerol-3-phosphate transport system substrate-binding protein
MIYDNKLYGLPETENFYVLAYRKDILNELELTVPNTWDDVLDMLPVLERYGMSFYVPLSNSSALKSFDTTAPFIYQFGGKLYADDGLSAAIDDENTLEAMTFMADLFREYSLSYQVPSFFNSFRDGRIPIGIADFGMYLQLLNAASEIKGLWDIALVPGVDDGQTINRFMPGAQQATVIFKKSEKVDRAWAFLKWWHSTETQILFSNTLVNTLGTRYLWNTANMEAFEALNWNSNHKDIILEQWTHLKEVPKIPGSYMVEREISNTLNSVVFFDANLRSTITDSILKMNKEIDRKMLEFGYIDQQGNPVKPFIIPSRSIVEGWANDND